MTRKSDSSTSIDDPFNQFINNLKNEMKNELQLKVYEDSERSFLNNNTGRSTGSTGRSQLLKNELKGSKSSTSTRLILPSLTTSLSSLGHSVPKLRLQDLKVELDDEHFQNRDYLKWGSLRSTFATPDEIEAKESKSKTKFKLPPINTPRFGDDNNDGKLNKDLYKLNDSILKKIKSELGPAITLKSAPDKNKRLKLPLLPGIAPAEGRPSRSLDEIKIEMIELNKKIEKVGFCVGKNSSDAERKAKEKLKGIAKEFQKELDGSIDPKILIKTPRSPKNLSKNDGEKEKAGRPGRKNEEKSKKKCKKVQFSDGSTSTVSDNDSFVSEMRSFLEDYEKKPTRESTPEMEPESDFSLDYYSSSVNQQGPPTTAGSSSTIKRIPMSVSMSRSVDCSTSTDQDNSQLTSDMTTMTMANSMIKKISLLDRWKIESLPLDAESLKQLQTQAVKENDDKDADAGICVNPFFHGQRSIMDIRDQRELSYTDQILLRKLRETSQTQIEI